MNNQSDFRERMYWQEEKAAHTAAAKAAAPTDTPNED